MSNSPEYQAAQYAYQTYHQRRIDIADNYSRQCDENKDRIIAELAQIAYEHGLTPTRIVNYAFGCARPDFISGVRRAISVLKAQRGGIDA